jgi:hypothetical protein
MLKLKFSSMYLIAFVALAVLLMTMLPSSCGGREGLENPDSSSPLPPPGPSIPEIDTRLTALEKSVNESKDKIAMGEAKANAAVGNLQMTLPA